MKKKKDIKMKNARKEKKNNVNYDFVL